MIWGSPYSIPGHDILPLYGIPPDDAFDPTADSRGLRLPRNDTISATQAWTWLLRNVDLNPALAEQPPPTAPAASRGVYVNWIDLYDAKEFRWHQFWMARQWGPVENVCAFGAVRWCSGDQQARFVAGMTDRWARVISFKRKAGRRDMVEAIWDWIGEDVEPAAGPPAAPAAPRGVAPGPPGPPPGLGPQQRQPPPPPPPPPPPVPVPEPGPTTSTGATSYYGAGAKTPAPYLGAMD